VRLPGSLLPGLVGALPSVAPASALPALLLRLLGR
jgi:hypothetical protein